MAIYTELLEDDLRAILSAYDLPPLMRAIPVPEGSINTNYRLELEGTKVFLRHSTVRSEADLDFEAAVIDALTLARVPAPRLFRTREGAAASLPYKGGRVSLFAFLPGEELTREQFTVGHARALGRALAQMHLALAGLSGSRANPYGAETVRGWLAKLDVPENDLGGIPRELEEALQLSQQDLSRLPEGVIHADLFIDNVKWTSPDSPFFFDFEMACRDALTLDAAITLNAWAFDGIRYLEPQARAFLKGYQSVRPLLPEERHALWSKALFGAVRYTASRIRDFHLSKLPADKLFKKDFRTYLQRTRVLRELGREGFLRLMELSDL